ncbi:MAG: exodeoxyribonuclease 7 large subunit [Candidatus Binatia bacterium]|nr:MAG: exodeoxyribonuclease 7 large subunit [Candidatus Binatia bacterium]
MAQADAPLPGVVPVFTVTELTQLIRQTLESQIDTVWVVGEVSNFRVPSSGHYYFILKDEAAQIAAVMFRGVNRSLSFTPEDGLKVLVRGHISMYEARGSLQLYVEYMEPVGIGSAQLALEQLKQRLHAEGLFAAERKRPLPFLPRCIGIVTALTGAAIRDILTVLRKRFPHVRVVIRPVRVQGKEAPLEIIAALDDLQQLPEVEVIIVGRGGGSKEDLWAFNDEGVARAIAGCRVPVVSAVGHEIDYTIADLVADARAPTPTAAATMVVPDFDELRARVAQQRRLLVTAFTRLLMLHRQRLEQLAQRLRDPRHTVENLRLRLDELAERAQLAMARRIEHYRQHLRALADRLAALNPLAVLERGYAIVKHSTSGEIVRDASTLSPGDAVHVQFARGRATAEVRETQS